MVFQVWCLGDVLTTSHRKKLIMLQNIARSVGIRLILLYDLSSDWIDLAEDRDRWRTLVSEMMNF